MSDQHLRVIDGEFSGYPTPKSNLVYVPNQFFEVVLRHSSRGCARLVGYLILQTFSEERFEDDPVQISQNALCKAAGLSRSQIRAALDEALERRFIVEIVRSKPNKSGAKAPSALGLKLMVSQMPVNR